MARLSVVNTVFVFAILYTIAMTLGALLPPVEVKNAPSFFDKILHTGAHFGLCVLWILWCVLKKPSVVLPAYVTRFKKAVWLVFFLVLLYGVLIEILQGTITSYRTPDIYDVLANSSGALLAVTISFLVKSKLARLKL